MLEDGCGCKGGGQREMVLGWGWTWGGGSLSQESVFGGGYHHEEVSTSCLESLEHLIRVQMG